MTWTDEQQQAINLTGTNIIVSAGAGSGKTAVLTERILTKLKQGVNINNLIILTFTNAAAFEMKERIRKKIKKEISNGNNRLKEQLDLIDQAIITTYDSFCLSLVKKYHYLLNIDEHINIIDSVIVTMEKKNIIDNIFECYYEKKNPIFLSFIDLYTVKDDQQIKNNILLLTNEIDKIYDIDLFLDNYVNKYLNKKQIDIYLNTYFNLIDIKKKRLLDLINKLGMVSTNDKLYTFYLELRGFITPFLDILKYNDYYQYFNSSRLPKMPIIKNSNDIEISTFKDCYQEIKDLYSELTDLCSYDNVDTIINEIESNYDYIKLIIDILKQYYHAINAFKLKHNLFEFNDISRLAITLLENNLDIREYYQNNIKEIMIDEYQDTNDINDYFISLIVNNNLYMVGDVKQSIYRFRNANPYIFIDKYNRYSHNDNGQKIDLNKNFRSRKEVIDSINLIFSHIMDENIGGAKYNPEHLLLLGNDKYLNNNDNYNLEILNYNYKDDDASNGYTKDEIEAFIIGKDIINKISNHYQILDKDNNIMRDVNYQDFCLLMDRKTSFDLYKKIFTYLNIPITIHRDEQFIYSDEIYALRSYLRLIGYYNHLEMDDYLLGTFMSVGRSFIYEYSDEQLFKVVLRMKEDNIDLFTSIKKEGLSLINDLEYLSKYAVDHSISNLIKEVYTYLDIYNKVIKLGDVTNVSIKLEYLLNIITELEQLDYHLLEVITYLDEAFGNELDLNYAINNNNSNSINLMSIHKSKGLEYPICYYSGLYKEFSKQDLKERFIFDKKYGLYLPVFKEGFKPTIIKEIIADNYNKEDISERLRVLYVALTRARDKIIIVGDFNKEIVYDDNEIINDYLRSNYNSFSSIIYSLKDILHSYFHNISLQAYNLSKEYEIYKTIDNINFDGSGNIQTIETNITKKEIVNKTYSHFVNKLQSNVVMNYGTIIHQYFEYLDFKDIDNSIINYHISNDLKDKIDNFMAMPFMKDIMSAQIYKEYSFITNFNNEIKRGVIDLLIEHDDTIIIVDYKLSNIDNDSYKEQVKGYMDYLKTISNKKIEGYIYSINTGEYVKV